MMRERLEFFANAAGGRTFVLLAAVTIAMAFGASYVVASLNSAGETASTAIPYDGYLEDGGAPLTGTVYLRVRFFDGSGAQVYAEQHNNVQVVAGRFRLLLGDGFATGTTNPVTFPGVSQGELSIELSVRQIAPVNEAAWTDLLGRQQLASVPYAHRAAPGHTFVTDRDVVVGTHADIGGDLTVAGQTALAGGLSVVGQVGIGTAAPNANAALDISSASRGLLLPRLTTANRNAMGAAANGMLLYNSSSNQMTVRAGGVWQEMGLNVVSREQTAVFSTSAAAWTDVPGFSQSITLGSAASKVLVVANVVAGMNGAVTGNYRVVRGATPIAVPPAVANYTSVSSASFYGGSADANNNEEATVVYLDSPAASGAVTYKIQVISLQGALMRVNALGSDTAGQTWSQRARSSLTLIEVK